MPDDFGALSAESLAELDNSGLRDRIHNFGKLAATYRAKIAAYERQQSKQDIRFAPLWLRAAERHEQGVRVYSEELARRIARRRELRLRARLQPRVKR